MTTVRVEEDALLPCPFCGEQPTFIEPDWDGREETGPWAMCESSNACPLYKRDTEVVAWNRRAAPSRSPNDAPRCTYCITENGRCVKCGHSPNLTAEATTATPTRTLGTCTFPDCTCYCLQRNGKTIQQTDAPVAAARRESSGGTPTNDAEHEHDDLIGMLRDLAGMEMWTVPARVKFERAANVIAALPTQGMTPVSDDDVKRFCDIQSLGHIYMPQVRAALNDFISRRTSAGQRPSSTEKA